MAAIGKTDLIARLAKSTGKSQKETAEVVNATLDTIRDALKAGDEVRLVDFGSFAVKTAAARQAVGAVSPGKALSEAVAK